MSRLELDSTGHIYLEPTPEVASGEIADPHVLRVNPARDDGQEIAERVVKCWNAFPDLLEAAKAAREVFTVMHSMRSSGPGRQAYEKLGAAIAKTTGGHHG